MSRPSDHFDSPAPEKADVTITQPRLGFVGYLRFFWRQLTSMRTALFLLLLLAIAAVPGSLVPQRSSDPNGVLQYFTNNPTLAPVLDSVQGFDVYSSAWFSAIYLLLFVSLIGCVVPRTLHHWRALRSKPPKTPARLERLEGFTSVDVAAGDVTATAAIESARGILKKSGYRVRLFGADGGQLSVSAERGYLRETGNLVFHFSLIGVLISVGIGGGFGYSGQKVIVEGDSFANVLLSYESFLPGRFFDESVLQPYRLSLDKFTPTYEQDNPAAMGQPIDYEADVTTYENGSDVGTPAVIKVNDPLRVAGSDVYLLGNGYAPVITVRDGQGNVAFSDAVAFLPQDANLMSLGVIKVPDALPEQIGMIGFFYPSLAESADGQLVSNFPDLINPTLSLRVFTGDLGLDAGIPRSVYSLATDNMTEVAGRTANTPAIELVPGQTVDLPGGIGTVTFENRSPAGTPASDLSQSVPRFASLDIHRDPSQGWVLVFALLVLAGLMTSLFIPRRRVWVKAVEKEDGSLRLEYAGLARGEDPVLEKAVHEIAERHSQQLGLKLLP
ncbi:MAG: cytochrome c biogenesis protein ResB [Burkholderiaceae bacterium]|nr:cytochrome c biogenesis protein ResB [Microbacteriaceae bacterium]